MNIKSHLFRIRTVTGFLSLHPNDFIPRSATTTTSTSTTTTTPSSDLVNVVDADDGNDDDGVLLRRLETSNYGVYDKISKTVAVLRTVEDKLIRDGGYTVQTLRLATNPFGEWLTTATTTTAEEEEARSKPNCDHDNAVLDLVEERLRIVDLILQKYGIEFCSLGPAVTKTPTQNNNNNPHTNDIDTDIAVAVTVCCKIIEYAGGRFSCSYEVPAGSTKHARAAAQCIVQISQFDDGCLGNFRFCAVADCNTPYIPFFPAAKSGSAKEHKHASANEHDDTTTIVKFAIGLENGGLARQLLKECHSIGNIPTQFKQSMTDMLTPVQQICENVVDTATATTTSTTITIPTTTTTKIQYLGIDTSLNPSLDDNGSVAEAIEQLIELNGKPFGCSGTLAAAAAITQALQTMTNITTVGYCGLMLPVCEDVRLAQLASSSSSSSDGQSQFQIRDLLSISSVCGVGVDTVPLAGNTDVLTIASLLLDVSGIANRWKKSLSCRVFPIPNKEVGDSTAPLFDDFPHLINSKVMGL